MRVPHLITGVTIFFVLCSERLLVTLPPNVTSITVDVIPPGTIITSIDSRHYRPVIERVTHDDGVFTLTGRQLNGPSDASAYGDDAQSNENFPIIRLQNSSGLVFYCRSTNWTSTSVGNIPHESVNFTLNPAVTPDVYQLIVSAGGISSAPFTIRISSDDLDRH